MFGWRGWVVPMYHPAMGLHQTSRMIPMLDDWDRLGRWVKDRWTRPVDKHPRPEYKLLRSVAEVERAMCDYYYDYLPIDTENDGPGAWSLQFSTRPGVGYMIRADQPELLEVFNSRLPFDWRGAVMHNAIHDLDVLDKMGVQVNHYRDTMQEAYHLGNLPQGLKSLAYRLCGVDMQAWEDLVMPYSRAKAVGWLLERLEEEYERRELVEIKLKTKVKFNRPETGMEKGLRRVVGHAQSKPEYDLWERAGELGAKQGRSEFTVGMPRASIAHVPMELAVKYGCRDADVTGRVAAELARLRGAIAAEGGGEWWVESGDWDQPSIGKQ